MTSGKTSVVFFGSGPVAAACLELLLARFPVEAVVTKPRPAHHKHDVPVLTVAKKHDLKVHTVSTKLELDALVDTKPFKSRLAVLIDFGIIVSQHAIDSFELGIVNSHFSLLPKLRGADPITFAILEGYEKTGVSLMMIDAGMDTGKLLTYRSLPLSADETSITLTEKLITLSDELLGEYLPRYISGELQPKTQPHPDRATYSRKLTKQDGQIDWREPADVIERKIRALQPWPRTRGEVVGSHVIITKAHVVDVKNTSLDIVCGDGKVLAIDELIAPSGKTMSAAAYLNGYLKNK